MSERGRQQVIEQQRPKRAASAVRRLPQHTVTELLVPLSTALDLAEGRQVGHAQRVAFLALTLAETLGLDAETRLACCHAALIHDIGVVPSGSGLAGVTQGDERLVFASLPLLTPEEAALGFSDEPELVVERLVEHTRQGQRAAQELLLSPAAVAGVAAHHENWDGSGYPSGLQREEIPLVARIVALADQLEGLISQSSPLQARRNLSHWLAELAGREADPELVGAMRMLGAGDTFWLGLYSENLAREIGVHSARLREPKAGRIVSFLETFARIVDSRFSFTDNVSARVARMAESLGRSLGLPEAQVRKLRLAALLHDVGQLAVSERIMSKPGILTVEELDVLRLHPTYSQEVARGIAGLEDVAEWIAAHHERLDGRGYPEGRSGDDVPLEARILAVADAYVAITSDRPHRPRAEGTEAAARLRSAAGSQLDAELVEVFLSRVIA